MVTTEAVSTPIEMLLAEKRVTLYHVSWRSYEKILDALGDSRAARLTYYNETLEIVTPLEEHESSSDAIGSLIHLLTEELNLNIKSMGSTTLKIPSLKLGAEPDKCYYIQNEPAVRGKKVDLTVDPPPDLVLEVDITHTDINKLQLYQEMKVPEWRYNGKTLTIYLLNQNQYEESQASAIPLITKPRIYEFLADCNTQGETQSKRAFRSWVSEQLQQ